MKVEDLAIIIATRKYGEKALMVTVLTESHGVYTGVVSYAFSVKNRVIYQIGNKVKIIWNARLDEHIGNIRADLCSGLPFSIIENKIKLMALNSICSLVITCICERVAEKKLYDDLLSFLSILANKHQCWHVEYIKLELLILKESGFGLDLTRCVATGTSDNLLYVSPKSGKAVCQSAGEPYKEKMLNLPQFLLGKDYSTDQFSSALNLVGYFLNKEIFAQKRRELPSPRKLLIELVESLK
jgi:DNA repair protein RecO (recombination protein O)